MGFVIETLASLSVILTWKVYLLALPALCILYYIYTEREQKGLPPGPPRLPFIGNALNILHRPLHETFAQLQHKYGDIFSLRLAGTEVVVINGYKNIRQALVNQGKSFNGRPDITWTSLTQRHGIFSMDGPAYHTQKSITMSLLSEVSWDKKEAAELQIQNCGKDLIRWLCDTANAPVNPQIYLDTATCNVTSKPLFGLTFAPADELMIAASKLAMDIFIDAGANNVNNYFTFLRHLPGDPTNYRLLKNNAQTVNTVVQGIVDTHKLRLEQTPDATSEDFVDHYLAKIREGSDKSCTEKQLVAIVTDLFAMGIEATSTTLRWALLLLCQHPRVLKKIQEEIDDVISGCTPSLEHQQEMNYINAVITEVQRYANVVSVNLPHSTTQQVNFEGYTVPKGTVVIPNLASVHYDGDTYAEPQRFNPERFITSDGFSKPEKFLPYSAGTRMCPGMNLSRWQLFIFLAMILQRFDIKLTGDVPNDVYGLIRYPGHFEVIFSERDGR